MGSTVDPVQRAGGRHQTQSDDTSGVGFFCERLRTVFSSPDRRRLLRQPFHEPSIVDDRALMRALPYDASVVTADHLERQDAPRYRGKLDIRRDGHADGGGCDMGDVD
ncbi:hypothetical protein AB4Z34_33840 [Ensifer sp. 2YAB10]